MKNHYLFFDTETTGLPKNYKAPISDVNNWPRLVQLAYIITDEIGNKIATKDFIIKPNGFIIPSESCKVHGITTEIANEKGKDLDVVMKEFLQDIESCNIIVAHNYDFDSKIVGCEFHRLGMTMPNKKSICTKEGTTNFCKLPNNYGYNSYKWPTLQELHYKLFGSNFEEAHNALIDIQATVKCFFECKQKHNLFN